MTTDYSLDVDGGSSEQGPFLRWYAAPPHSGVCAAGNFVVHEAGGNTTVVDLSKALVFDWAGSKTGWMESGGVAGVAPQKKWNASRSKMEPQPGENWKKAFHVQVAYLLDNAPSRAVWEQNQYASFAAYRAIMALIAKDAAANLPKLPMFGYTGYRREKIGNGTTLVPEFKLVRWVQRPACLSDDADAAAPAPQAAADAWGAATKAAPRNSGNGAHTAQMGNATVPLPRAVAPQPGGGAIDDDVVPFSPCVQ
jgi:hypothetical protein